MMTRCIACMRAVAPLPALEGIALVYADAVGSGGDGTLCRGCSAVDRGVLQPTPTVCGGAGGPLRRPAPTVCGGAGVPLRRPAPTVCSDADGPSRRLAAKSTRGCSFAGAAPLAAGPPVDEASAKVLLFGELVAAFGACRSGPLLASIGARSLAPGSLSPSIRALPPALGSLAASSTRALPPALGSLAASSIRALSPAPSSSHALSCDWLCRMYARSGSFANAASMLTVSSLDLRGEHGAQAFIGCTERGSVGVAHGAIFRRPDPPPKVTPVGRLQPIMWAWCAHVWHSVRRARHKAQGACHHNAASVWRASVECQCLTGSGMSVCDCQYWTASGLPVSGVRPWDWPSRL
eukprot:364649-Chlamydomonas_euryale.AAC.5